MTTMIRIAAHFVVGIVCLAIPALLIVGWVVGARGRLSEVEAAAEEGPQVAVATAAEEGYCSVELKKVLRRVLQSCGLLSSGEVRGCQPLEAKNVATVSGDDFNALFVPLAERAGI